jgi:hypothetical protein
MIFPPQYTLSWSKVQSDGESTMLWDAFVFGWLKVAWLFQTLIPGFLKLCYQISFENLIWTTLEHYAEKSLMVKAFKVSVSFIMQHFVYSTLSLVFWFLTVFFALVFTFRLIVYFATKWPLRNIEETLI